MATIKITELALLSEEEIKNIINVCNVDDLKNAFYLSTPTKGWSLKEFRLKTFNIFLIYKRGEYPGFILRFYDCKLNY